MKRRWVLAALPLAGCVSVEVGGESPAQLQLALRDIPGATVTPRRAAPLVDALLVHALPGAGPVDSSAIAYSRREGEFRLYQLATWTERPVRQLPPLLVQRTESRGLAASVGQLGDPLRADWLLAVDVDGAYHDVAAEPGTARLAFAVALFDRRTRTRLAYRGFHAAVPVAQADAPSAVQALSVAVGRCFDELLPWLEEALGRAVAARR
jgi:ABC-type uncharacterized transport system auxiliary subunit